MHTRPPDIAYIPPTVLRVGTDGGEGYVKVHLRHPLGVETVRRLSGEELRPPYAVIALAGAPGTAEEERRHTKSFADELRDGEHRYWLSSVSDEQETYEHPAISIALPLEEAIAMAHRHGQPDLHWFDGRAFWYVPVPAGAGPPVRLPFLSLGWL